MLVDWALSIHKMRASLAFFLSAIVGMIAPSLIAQEKDEVLGTSPSGAFRIESKFPDQSAEDATADV
jgi:hypothetical protein